MAAEANGNGWNNGPVQVSLTARDETALAGISSSAVGAHPLVEGNGVSPRVLTISEPGTTTLSWTATDGAGNDTSRQLVVTVTEPTTVDEHLAALRERITLNPMDEVLRKQRLNDLVLLEKAYEKGRGATKRCKELATCSFGSARRPASRAGRAR